MAVLCREQKLLFIMVPRTGCTAVRNWLVEHLGGQDIPIFVRPTKHMNLKELIEDGTVIDNNSAKGLFKFCCVRNPYDRLVSHYYAARTIHANLLEDPKSFVHQRPAYLQDIRIASRYSFNYWVIRKYMFGAIRSLILPKSTDSFYAKFTEGMDSIMRFEHLSDDFTEIIKRSGITIDEPLPRVNESGRIIENYRQTYSLMARIVVMVRFRADISRYGYQF